MDSQYLNDMSRKIYQQNCDVGWWDDPDRCIYTCLQLSSTEIAEATEGERKGLVDDHLPHRRSGEVELADSLIRVLDVGGHLELVYDPEDSRVSPVYGTQPAQLHLWLNYQVINLANAIRRGPEHDDIEFWYARLVFAHIKAADILGYDIKGAMEEKLEYNRTRADHKREERAKPGGKSF